MWVRLTDTTAVPFPTTTHPLCTWPPGKPKKRDVPEETRRGKHQAENNTAFELLYWCDDSWLYALPLATVCYLCLIYSGWTRSHATSHINLLSRDPLLLMVFFFFGDSGTILRYDRS
ncbi:hypothetical protein EV127DRAFT_435044 [Xylaria flabelliformis]|nr:hypothetical protein EV127DRAFT_435044 [Xylaria flabelliformis]